MDFSKWRKRHRKSNLGHHSSVRSAVISLMVYVIVRSWGLSLTCGNGAVMQIPIHHRPGTLDVGTPETTSY